MDPMIVLQRLGGPVFALNPDLIERAEATPDTVVTMVGGNKYVICESLSELTQMILEHRAQIIATAELMGLDTRRSPGATAGKSFASTSHLQDVTRRNQGEYSTVIPIRSEDV
jgi:flagellar protein FlbD